MNRFLLAILIALFFTSVYAGPDFTGTWETNWGTVELKQSGNSVTGTYSGPFTGDIEGTVEGKRLTYRWIQSNGQWGSGYFILSEDFKTIKGMWGIAHSATNGGPWEGSRVK